MAKVKRAAETGMQYEFLLTMERADGSGGRNETCKVIAIDKAQAWHNVGREVERFMRSPRGMLVTNVQLEGPR